MDELISRQAVIDTVYDWSNYAPTDEEARNIRQVINDIKALPSIQPERKMGKWVSRENELKHRDWVSCSRCTGIFDYRWKFCPNCGAKMEE